MERRKIVEDDDDVPELTLEDFRRARPAEDVTPGIAEAARRARARGRPPLEKPKAHVSMRVDPDVLKEFKAKQGKGWQTRIAELMARANARAKKTKAQRNRREKRKA
jgi:uncharacterized protein (DUF4415 family)